jgi:cation diffusion facilitator CzcD-associated flavoprotein CzcO
VAVIGTGSSAIQTIPQVQRKASHVVAFMRSVTWISPVVGEADLEAEKAKHTTESDRETQDDGKLAKQYWYTEEDKQRFRDDPEYLLLYRKKLESAVNNLFDMFISGSDVSKGAHEMMRAEMNRRIGPGHEELKQRLIPKWSPGCRRITPGDGYLEALVKPNVTTIHEEIEKVVPEGLIDGTGKLHEVDIIACATGFNIAFAPPFEVYGTNGVRMKDQFEPEPQVYLAMAVPKFPNYFIINGVRGNWAAGTSLPSHEVCVEYILKAVKKIQEENIRALEVKQEPVTQLYEHVDAWHQGSPDGQHKGSVWNDECKSW